MQPAMVWVSLERVPISFIPFALLVFLVAVAIVQLRKRGGSTAVPSSVMQASILAAQRSPELLTVRLVAPGPNKIRSIKAIRSVCPEHGLAAAKYLVDHIPSVVCAGVTADRAARAKREFEAVGLTVDVS